MEKSKIPKPKNVPAKSLLPVPIKRNILKERNLSQAAVSDNINEAKQGTQSSVFIKDVLQPKTSKEAVSKVKNIKNAASQIKPPKNFNSQLKSSKGTVSQAGQGTYRKTSKNLIVPKSASHKNIDIPSAKLKTRKPSTGQVVNSKENKKPLKTTLNVVKKMPSSYDGAEKLAKPSRSIPKVKEENLKPTSNKNFKPTFIKNSKFTSNKNSKPTSNKNSKPVSSTQSTTVVENDQSIPVVKVQPMARAPPSNLDNDDLEFQASGFYKNLILSERALSPAIMKLCCDSRVSANAMMPPAKELYRNTSAAHFIEDLKRNSAKFIRRNGRLQYSPSVRASPFKAFLSSKEHFTSKEIAAGVRRISEQKQNLFNCPPSDAQNTRRWTCNIQNSNNENKNAYEIVAEIRRLSEIRRESLYNYPDRQFSSVNHLKASASKPYSALREIDALLSKRKDKSKKKVTFNIPDSSSPDLSQTMKEFKKSEKLHLTNTPSFDIHSASKLEFNLQQKNTEENSTPELNLMPFSLHSDLLLNENNIEKPKTENQDCTPELNLMIQTHEQLSKKTKFCLNEKSCYMSSVLSPNPLTNIDKNIDVCHKLNIPCDNFIACKITPPIIPSSFSSSVISSLEKLDITSPSASKAKLFSVNSKKKIYTPRPVSVHQNCYSRTNISPLFPNISDDLCPNAPICTPLVLKNIAKIEDFPLNSIRQRLTFDDEPICLAERRESQSVLQSIPTYQRMQDILCDQECNIISMQSTSGPYFRTLQNPIANVLSYGDEMHFVPLDLSPKK